MTGKFLTTAEVAELVRTSPATVRYWRYLGRGPAGIKVGKRVRYDPEDVQSWIDQHKDSGPTAT
jgi:hypothetical protein